MGLSIEDLDKETLAKMGLTKPRQYKFNAENERQFAIKVLAVMTNLTQSQRQRVLKRACSMNGK